MKISLTPEPPFSFKSTLFSHGWIDLQPFNYYRETNTLSYHLVVNDQLIEILFTSGTDKEIEASISRFDEPSDAVRLKNLTTRMFRLNEDFSGLYAECSRDPDLKWIENRSAGRMFRSGSVWEDMVKMLCTTNCNWNLTRIMCRNLVTKLGNGGFPGPEAILAVDEQFLRNEIKMGYRAPYLMEFAHKMAGQNDLPDRLEIWPGDSVELYKKIRTFKGFGHYAASNLLKLLGHYDYYGSDSSTGKKFSEKHFDNKACTDREIAAFYDHFGRWCGLVFWLDMTSDWYEDHIPW